MPLLTVQDSALKAAVAASGASCVPKCSKGTFSHHWGLEPLGG